MFSPGLFGRVAGTCLGFDAGGADYRMCKILPLMRIRELCVDWYNGRRG